MSKRKFNIFSLFALLFIAIFGLASSIFVYMEAKENVLVVTPRKESVDLNLKMSRLSSKSINQVEVTATLSPSNATNKALKWELKWCEENNEDVADYVKIDVSTTTLTCILTFKEPFNEPMELLCSSVSNPNITATCDVGCYERTVDFNNVKLNVSLDKQSSVDLGINQSVSVDNEITFDGATTFKQIFEDDMLEINRMTVSSVKKGSISTISNYNYKIQLSEQLQVLLDNRNITYDSTEQNLSTNSVKRILESLITFTSSNQDDIYESLNHTELWFNLIVNCDDYYNDIYVNSYSKIYELTGFYIGDHYSTIIIPTDLTGYKVTIPGGFSAESGFGQFDIKGSPYFNEVSDNCYYSGGLITFHVGYYCEGEGIGCDITETTDSVFVQGDEGFGNWGISVNKEENIPIFLFITGGEDVTNSQLIQWLVDNGATFEKAQSNVPTDLTGYKVTLPPGWTVPAGYSEEIGVVDSDYEYYYIPISGFFIDADNQRLMFDRLLLGYELAPFDEFLEDEIEKENSILTVGDYTYKYNLSNDSEICLTFLQSEFNEAATNQAFIQWLVDNDATFEMIDDDNVYFWVYGEYVWQTENGTTWQQWINDNPDYTNFWIIGDDGYIYTENTNWYVEYICYDYEGDTIVMASDLIESRMYYRYGEDTLGGGMLPG